MNVINMFLKSMLKEAGLECGNCVSSALFMSLIHDHIGCLMLHLRNGCLTHGSCGFEFMLFEFLGISV